MSAGVQFFLLFIAMGSLGCVIESRRRRRNRWTRSGWRVSRTTFSDASCRSGWKAYTQPGHRY